MKREPLESSLRRWLALPFARRVMICLAGLLIVVMTVDAGSARAYSIQDAGYVNVMEGITQADLIVKGKVLAVERMPKSRSLARIRVDGVLKGQTLAKNIEIINDQDINMFNITVGEYALFFLKQTDRGLMQCDPHWVGLEVRKGAPKAPATMTDPVELVRNELLFTASGPYTLPLKEGIIYDVVVNGRGTLSKRLGLDSYSMAAPLPINIMAAGQLYFLPPDQRTLDLWCKLLKSKNWQMRGHALPGLIRQDPHGMLQTALDFFRSAPVPKTVPMKRPEKVMTPEEDLKWAQAWNHMVSVMQLRGETGDHDTTVRVSLALHSIVPKLTYSELGVLLGCTDDSVRAYVVQYLSRISRSEGTYSKPLTPLLMHSILPLIVRALDDSNRKIREQAVAALSQIAVKPEWKPTYRKSMVAGEKFDAEQEKVVINRWKQWWEKEAWPLFEATTGSEAATAGQPALPK